MSAAHDPWLPLKILFFFGLHVIAGMVIFVVVGGAAWALSEFVHFLEFHGAPAYITMLMTLVEYLLFGSDVYCFVAFIVDETLDFQEARKSRS